MCQGMSRIERLIDRSKDIKQTCIDASPELKREHLDLFFSKFMVKDGKIIAALPSEYIKPLISNGKLTVRIRNGWLERWETFRNIDWLTCLEYPEFTTKEVNRFLNFQ